MSVLTERDRARLAALRAGTTTYSQEMEAAAIGVAVAVEWWDRQGRPAADLTVAAQLAEWRRASRRLHLAVAVWRAARQRREAVST